jgi:hypothetical protein
MKQLRKQTRLLLLSMAICLWVAHAEAQTQTSKIQIAKSSQQGLTGSLPQSLKLSVLKGGLALSNGNTTTTICNDGKVDAATICASQVFYIKNSSSIQIYDIKSKTTKDLVKTSGTGTSYHADNKIDKMLVDNNSNRVYFSTYRTNPNGHKEALCWHYDIASGALTLYRDGSLESVDANGNQTIAFEGKDSRGAFVSRTIVNANGKIINNLGKSYTLLNNK